MPVSQSGYVSPGVCLGVKACERSRYAPRHETRKKGILTGLFTDRGYTTNVAEMMGQRQRRWPIIVAMLGCSRVCGLEGVLETPMAGPDPLNTGSKILLMFSELK